MNQPVAQNKNISPVDKKHSASSESSYETNVESEHPDAIGTPLMTATTSESGVQVGSSEEGRVQEKEISSKDQAKVSKGNEGLVGSMPTATRKAQLSEKKSFSFPEKVVSCIISHVFLLSMRDPVTSPVSERAPPFWTIAFQATPHLFPHFEYRWKLLRFASWLRDLQSVKDTWAAAGAHIRKEASSRRQRS
ncbi:hypothetical protein QFC22_000367 [Naganishia vaughanmartiniae]|uniref:Uncharacterized protein n=1 Tax=Naganishia vaughanmartiniae TaxID=1424756 RepID=A0ACC2XN51_9TREE|nr:hypothetical protein QFC22_000367 [Naganishia vaughanmartiniae]